MSTGVFSLFSHLGVWLAVLQKSQPIVYNTQKHKGHVFQATSGQNRQENETHEERPSKDWEEARLAKLPSSAVSHFGDNMSCTTNKNMF